MKVFIADQGQHPISRESEGSASSPERVAGVLTSFQIPLDGGQLSLGPVCCECTLGSSKRGLASLFSKPTKPLAHTKSSGNIG